MKNYRAITFAGVIGLLAAPALAVPPIWESNFGSELTNMTDWEGAAEWDDGSQDVTLSFLFPYAGSSYDLIVAGTNGAVGLGGLGEADDYPSSDEFIETVDPMIAPFWSDMDLDEIGGMWFNDFGDRAVFTWDGIGTWIDEYSPNTFQLQLFEDGKIIFGYNGVQDVNDDYFDVDVHVGLTEGNLLNFPTEVDYTADAPFFTDDTVFELFEYGSAGRGTSSEFDLDHMNIIFTPQRGGGYLVTVPEPATLGLLALGGLAAIRRRRRSS